MSAGIAPWGSTKLLGAIEANEVELVEATQLEATLPEPDDAVVTGVAFISLVFCATVGRGEATCTTVAELTVTVGLVGR